jgi:Ubiquitin family
LQGRTITLDLNGDTTVASLKQQIRTQIAVDRFRIFFAGKDLDDERTLSYYNIQKESTLHVVPILATSANQVEYVKEVHASDDFYHKAVDCDNTITATVVDFIAVGDQMNTRPEYPTVENLLIAGPTECIYKANDYDPRANPPIFRWIHLPANNMSWVEVRRRTIPKADSYVTDFLFRD